MAHNNWRFQPRLLVKTQYHLTRNYHETKNSLRTVCRNFRGICTLKISGKDFFKQLSLKFAIFAKISISELFFVSNNFVPKGTIEVELITYLI